MHRQTFVNHFHDSNAVPKQKYTSKKKKMANHNNEIAPHADGSNQNKKLKSNNARRTIVIGDSRIKRLHNQPLPNGKANGSGGLQSHQLIPRLEEFVDKELANAEEIIIHAGCNDVKSKAPKAIVKSIDTAAKHYIHLKDSIHLSISSMFLRKDDTMLNAKIVETNNALRAYCWAQGFDYIDHGNIAFWHLDRDVLHLNPEGTQLFLHNICAHIKGG